MYGFGGCLVYLQSLAALHNRRIACKLVFKCEDSENRNVTVSLAQATTYRLARRQGRTRYDAADTRHEQLKITIIAGWEIGQALA